VTPNKRLGQHFLTDRNILERIVDALDPAPGDVVLEIGPGKGSLTEALLARGLTVIAVEKDRRLAEHLRDQVSGVRCQVVTGDALRLDWYALSSEHQPPDTGHRLKVIGNIPYNITSPLLEKALAPPLPERVVFLVQKEVADRLAAGPGSRVYGALSVGVQAQCDVERLFTVPAGAFTPRPRVTSALVRLTPLPESAIAPDEVPAFRAFVTACFGRRRKQLRNVLMGVTGQSAAVVTAGLRELGLDAAARPETLGPPDFARLLRWSVRL